MSDVRGGQMGLRVVGAVGLAVGIVIHVLVAFTFGGTLGILFALSALGMLVGAVLLFTSPRLGWIVGAVVAGLTALGYVLRSTVGLPPLIPNPVPFSRPVSGVVSTVAEILVVLLAVWVLTRSDSRSRTRSASRSAV